MQAFLIAQSAGFQERLMRRDEGAGIVEYLLLVVFIALVLIVALGYFSGQLGTAFSAAADSATG